MAKKTQKTHKGISKVLKVRPSGTIKIGCPASRHNTGKQTTKLNRKKRAGSTLSRADYNRLKDLI